MDRISASDRSLHFTESYVKETLFRISIAMKDKIESGEKGTNQWARLPVLIKQEIANEFKIFLISFGEVAKKCAETAEFLGSIVRLFLYFGLGSIVFFILWNFIDPPAILDKQIASLTLGEIGKWIGFLLATILFVGSVLWLFSDEHLISDKYLGFGVLAVLIILGLGYWRTTSSSVY